jgi:hypothetical protein
VKEPDGKSPIGRQGCSWKGNVKMKCGERDCEGVKLYVILCVLDKNIRDVNEVYE